MWLCDVFVFNLSIFSQSSFYIHSYNHDIYSSNQNQSYLGLANIQKYLLQKNLLQKNYWKIIKLDRV